MVAFFWSKEFFIGGATYKYATSGIVFRSHFGKISSHPFLLKLSLGKAINRDSSNKKGGQNSRVWNQHHLRSASHSSSISHHLGKQPIRNQQNFSKISFPLLFLCN
ncbi:hypothetical protein ACOSQ4_018986 [Xanthoceras sorbifolium]